MHDTNRFLRFQGTPGYIASGPLVDAVNCAIALERPLLLRGEPGTGKTVLARHVAQGLEMPLISWHVKSTSKAVEGLYLYDTVQRLNDSRFGTGDVSDIKRYIKLGPLGSAFAAETRQVLLIDEIDKSDSEFEAFLLEVLSDFTVSVPELGTLRAKHIPIVLLTSNNAREMSDALKRRCLHLYIDFPGAQQELSIVRLKVPGISEKLAAQVVEAVQRIRKLDLKKSPSISETLDWAKTLTLLNADQLDEELVNDTLSAVLKYEGDIRKAQDDLKAFLQTQRARTGTEQGDDKDLLH